MANNTPLNTFKNLAVELTTSTTVVYTTPAGVTTIVLGAMASNFSNQATTVKFSLVKNSTEFVLLNDFEIPPNDAAEVITSKLVIEENSSVQASAGEDGRLNLAFSILETSNE
jgi:N-acetylmuramic acid 6-phosphate (MurNAc-6-P) etherase